MAFDFGKLTQDFQSVLDLIADEMKSIKTGRAKPSMVEDVMVEAYGTKMPLKELASITAPDPNLIVISPWDRGVIEAIEKALSSGKSQFNPTVDQTTIRVVVPQLTGETREEMVKLVAQKVESGKQMLRAARTEAKKEIEAQKGTGGVSEDDIAADEKKLDEKTQEYTHKLEQLGKDKEQELRTI